MLPLIIVAMMTGFMFGLMVGTDAGEINRLYYVDGDSMISP